MLFIGGKWLRRKQELSVYNPYTFEEIGKVSIPEDKDIEFAVERAKIGLRELAKLSSCEKSRILLSVAERIRADKERLAKILVMEVGKTIREARTEVARAIETFTLSAEEAKRIYGETVPYDSVPYGKGRKGFYIRVPAGIVLAIAPFNFPFNLVAHKVGPALACGDPVILKPSSLTPFIAIELVKILLDAGLPPDAIALLPGPGGKIGDKLVSHPDIRIVSFTGSLEVAERLTRLAGFKRLIIEAGSNSACVVFDDANLEFAAKRIAIGAMTLAGQVCISVQRVFVHNNIWNEFIDLLKQEVEKLKLGDPMDESTDVGPMITEDAAERAKNWVDEAVKLGARIITGGKVNNSLFAPTILINVPRTAKIYHEEAFAPVVCVNKFNTVDEAIELTNDTKYGLQAGVFTSNLKIAFEFINHVDAGGIIINDVPTFRADPMPYGGMKLSGLGREGPKFAIEELTEIKSVCFNLEN